MEGFKKGAIITLNDGKTVKVNKELGKGGQGIVYDVSLDNKHYALKWYLPEYLKSINQKEFYDNLRANQETGAPSNQFLWPLSISTYTKDSFGYLMELRPSRYIDFTSILNVKKRFKNVKTQLTAARNISIAFQSLHKRGYSYQDINDGNFFIDINNGDVLVCDNDNVAPYGTWMGMAGKDRYMAPEVVLREKHAGMESDLFSLAVIIFMILFNSHPLEGKQVHECPCLTANYIKKFYAENPVFIFDPNNDQNRPVIGIDNNVLVLWPYYDQKIKDLFIRSFTKGLKESGYRVRENEWIACLDEIINSILICPHCGGEHFYVPGNDDKLTYYCEDCKNSIRKPFYFTDVQSIVLLHPQKKLILGNELIGEIVESTKHKGLWGIKNKSANTIVLSIDNGNQYLAKKDEIIPLFANGELIINSKKYKVKI